MVALGRQAAQTVEAAPAVADGDRLRIAGRIAIDVRCRRVRRLEATSASGAPSGETPMTGLEDRLKRVGGVADIVVELDADGLAGVRVRLNEGAQETDVLEEIRRILVAYGLKATRRRTAPASLPSLELGLDDDPEEPTGDDGPDPSDDSGVTAPVNVSVLPVDGRLVARLSDGTRTVEASAEATPLGATEAIIRATAEWRGVPPPHRIAVDRLDIDDADVVVLVARRGQAVVTASSIVSSGLGDALGKASALVMDRLEG